MDVNQSISQIRKQLYSQDNTTFYRLLKDWCHDPSPEHETCRQYIEQHYGIPIPYMNPHRYKHYLAGFNFAAAYLFGIDPSVRTFYKKDVDELDPWILSVITFDWMRIKVDDNWKLVKNTKHIFSNQFRLNILNVISVLKDAKEEFILEKPKMRPARELCIEESIMRSALNPAGSLNSFIRFSREMSPFYSNYMNKFKIDYDEYEIFYLRLMQYGYMGKDEMIKGEHICEYS